MKLVLGGFSSLSAHTTLVRLVLGLTQTGVPTVGCSTSRQGVWDGESQVSWNFALKIELKSLILAQIERWRHALHMQVERQRGGNPGGERRTGE